MFAWFLIVATLGAAPPASAAHEAEARRLEAELVAPCCWRQQVVIHDSPIAQEIRADIRERLARGETAEEIKSRYIAQYGAAILVEPPATGFNLLLYAVPPLVFVASGTLLLVLVRRFTRTRSSGAIPAGSAASATSIAAGPTAAAGTPAAYDRRLDDELSDLE